MLIKHLCQRTVEQSPDVYPSGPGHQGHGGATWDLSKLGSTQDPRWHTLLFLILHERGVLSVKSRRPQVPWKGPAVALWGGS